MKIYLLLVFVKGRASHRLVDLTPNAESIRSHAMHEVVSCQCSSGAVRAHLYFQKCRACHRLLDLILSFECIRSHAMHDLVKSQCSWQSSCGAVCGELIWFCSWFSFLCWICSDCMFCQICSYCILFYFTIHNIRYNKGQIPISNVCQASRASHRLVDLTPNLKSIRSHAMHEVVSCQCSSGAVRAYRYFQKCRACHRLLDLTRSFECTRNHAMHNLIKSQRSCSSSWGAVWGDLICQICSY